MVDNITQETVQEINAQIQLINIENKNLSNKIIVEKLNELIAVVNLLQTKQVTVGTPRDRGPKSEKQMTDEDAKRIMLGDLKSVSHKECAVKLGLSYGQIYSARKGFTFKTIYKEMMDVSKVIAQQ